MENGDLQGEPQQDAAFMHDQHHQEYMTADLDMECELGNALNL